MPIDPSFDYRTGQSWEISRRAAENVVRQRREAALLRAAEQAERDEQTRQRGV